MTVEHLSLSGHSDVFPLTPDAKRSLLAHLARSRTATATGPDGDEIVRDVETRIGDRSRRALDAGAKDLDEPTVRDVLAEIGPFDTDSRERTRPPALCPIDRGRWFGGLCLGLATRGEFRLDRVRTGLLAPLTVVGEPRDDPLDLVGR